MRKPLIQDNETYLTLGVAALRVLAKVETVQKHSNADQNQRETETSYKNGETNQNARGHFEPRMTAHV